MKLLTVSGFLAAFCGTTNAVFSGQAPAFCSQWVKEVGWNVDGQMKVDPVVDGNNKETFYTGALKVMYPDASGNQRRYGSSIYMYPGTESCNPTRGGSAWTTDGKTAVAEIGSSGEASSFGIRTIFASAKQAVDEKAKSLIVTTTAGAFVGCCDLLEWKDYVEQSPAPCSEYPCITVVPLEVHRKWFITLMIFLVVVLLPMIAVSFCLALYSGYPDIIGHPDQELLQSKRSFASPISKRSVVDPSFLVSPTAREVAPTQEEKKEEVGGGIMMEVQPEEEKVDAEHNEAKEVPEERVEEEQKGISLEVDAPEELQDDEDLIEKSEGEDVAVQKLLDNIDFDDI